MLPLQRLIADDGYEVCLFPLEYLYLSTAEHQDLAMDFWGWNSLGRVYDCPCYAPVSGSVVYTGNDHNMIFWSSGNVHCADGTITPISILVAHSNTPPGSVGTTYVQGELWYHTGNYGQSTGDHLHMEVAKGHVMWNQTGTALENPEHLYNVMFVNDTILSRPLDFNWLIYNDSPTPIEKGKKTKFPWVLYSRRLREKRTHV